MKFSILITIYNAEKYIERCIRSVLTQEKAEFEILLYNDASTDSSGKICDEYHNKYPDIVKVFHSEVNKGSVNGRLELYKKAAGEVIIWMDADDYMVSNALHEIRKAFNAYNCDLVIYDFYKSYQLRCGGRLNRRRSNFCKNMLYGEKEKRYLYEYFASQKCNSLWRKAFKRALFDMVIYEGLDTEDINLGDDLLLSLPIIDNAGTTLYLHKALYYYCQNNSSMLQTTKLEQGWNSLDKVWSIAEKFCEKWDVIPRYYEGVIEQTCCYLEKIKVNYSNNNEDVINLLNIISNDLHLGKAIAVCGIENKKLELVMDGKYELFLDNSGDIGRYMANYVKKKLLK